jgi:hypothetical protein
LEGSRDTCKVTSTKSNDSGSGCELLDYPARPGEPLCPAYIKYGDCKLKSECWYDHPKVCPAFFQYFFPVFIIFVCTGLIAEADYIFVG